MPDSRPLGVVVVSYGDPDVLARHALAPARLHAWGDRARVVVVDNPSAPAYRAAVRRLCVDLGVELVEMDRNEGFGGAANAGARRALALGCSAVLFLNPDAELDATTLSALHAAVLDEPRALVSPVIDRPDGTPWFAGADLSLRHGTTRRVGRRGGPDLEPWLTGACLAASALLWHELGGFDEDYFLYWEDVDLSHRCLVAGGSLNLRSDLRVVHVVGGTQAPAGASSHGKSPVYLRHNTRGRLLFAAKHLSRRRALRWALGAPQYAMLTGLRGGARSTLTSSAAVVALLQGSAEGLAAVATSLGRRG